MVKKNLTIILIIVSTLILAGLAFLAIYKMKKEPVIAPTVPQRKPKAVEKPAASNDCELTFRVVAGPTNTPGPTSTPGPGPTATPTTYITSCYTQCESDSNCSNSLVCRENPYRPGEGVKVCLNDNCPRERSCYCPGPTSTPAPPTPTSPVNPPGPTSTPVPPISTPVPTIPGQPTNTPTPTPITIPPVGMVENTFLAVLAGSAFIIIALLFAF